MFYFFELLTSEFQTASSWLASFIFDASSCESWFFYQQPKLYLYVKDFFGVAMPVNSTFAFVFKLSFLLVFLSAVKGGTPRYRYDFLTKMGWVKFLGHLLTLLIFTLLLSLIW